MFEKLFFGNLKWRQEQALDQAKKAAKNLSKGKNILASLMIILQALGCLWYDLPRSPSGQELDLSGYTLVFEDDFDGDSLDLNKWSYRANGARRGGYNHPGQVRVEDGNMILSANYLEDGEYGPGWYGGMVRIIEEYTFGYFEMKCIINSDDEFWSAFWLQSSHSYNPGISKGGVGGAEIDIFESFSYSKNFLRRNALHQTIWCSGMEGDPTNGEGLNSLAVGRFNGKDIYEEYNTYGLEWDENEYIFYINGVETARTSFADGTSKVPEQVIASLEIPDEITHDKDFTTEFIIDYVKVYQK